MKVALPTRLLHFLRYIKNGRSYSLYNIDNQCISIFNHQKDGYFIELGANDGVKQSNTYKLERKYGWHGLLIEPSKEKLQQCKKNRKDGNAFIHAACVRFGYPKRSITLQYADLMTIGETSSLDQKAHSAKAMLNAPGNKKYTFDAPARSLNDILVDTQAPRTIDFLSLDVEGAELDVLKGIDFTYFTFAYMVIECWDFRAIATFLSAVGYIPHKQLSHHDWLFVHSN